MFEAKIELEIFKEFVTNLMIVVEEINLHISEKGFNARAVDVANVSMISCELKKVAFEHYFLDNEININVGLYLSKIYDLLNGSNKNGIIKIEINTKTQKLYIIYENLSYSTSLLDPSSIRSEPNVPKIAFSNKLCINGLEFKKAIKAAERINDYVILGLKNNTFYIEAKNETDRLYLSLDTNFEEEINNNINISSIYSIDYLLNFTKVIKKTIDLHLSIGQDYPLLVTFDMINNFGTIIYFLAPRIESE